MIIIMVTIHILYIIYIYILHIISCMITSYIHSFHSSNLRGSSPVGASEGGALWAVLHVCTGAGDATSEKNRLVWGNSWKS